nr:DUF3592 domain-containing protein [Nocardioides luti]
MGAGAVFLLGAGLLFLRGLRQRRFAAGFRASAVEVLAEVLSLEAKDVSLTTNPETLYFPVVSFTTAEGRAVTAECLTGVPAPPPPVGQQVAVRYDPQHPERVEVLDDAEGPVSAALTSFLLARVLLGLAVAMPLAWLVLVFVVWTS